MFAPPHQILWAQDPATVPAPTAPAPVPAAPAPAPSASRRVALPEGEGKAIATDFCQECHRLTNLTSARRTADEWRETVLLMIDRGASIPQDKIPTLVEYLAKNFGPKEAAPAAPPDASAPAAPPPAAPGVSTSRKAGLPEGDAKAIATEYCQDCHQLSNVTNARKTAEEWRETVQVMMDRGARLPSENMNSLVEYLVKNFGPKQAALPASAGTAIETPSSPQSPR